MTKLTKNDLGLKEQLYQLCSEFVEKRLQTVQNTIHEIQESLTSETKSSAGDKHETGRAMLQLEREKAGHQLAEIEKLKQNLSKIDISKSSDIIGLGSVVFTSQGNYFIAISAGQMDVDGTKFFAISQNTPIGLWLKGKTIDAEFVFREQRFFVENLI
ncbi:MAG: 3-oxoacyl-ACP synthase [Aquaticitalea sp.]